MDVDWSARLREQSRFAKRMASELPAALSDPRITIDEAEQLLRTVKNCAMSFEAMAEEMRRGRPDASHLRTTAVISAVWLDLTRFAADKVQALRQPPRRRAY